MTNKLMPTTSVVNQESIYPIFFHFPFANVKKLFERHQCAVSPNYILGFHYENRH